MPRNLAKSRVHIAWEQVFHTIFHRTTYSRVQSSGILFGEEHQHPYAKSYQRAPRGCLSHVDSCSNDSLSLVAFRASPRTLMYLDETASPPLALIYPMIPSPTSFPPS